MIILHPYAPDVRPADQQRCWAELARWPLAWITQVVHYPCRTPLAYAEGLRAVWDEPGNLVVIEHDIALTWDEMLRLHNCDGEVCAYDYLLPDGRPWTEHTDRGCWGATKISHEARQAITERPAVPLVGWQEVAMRTAERLPAPHVHYPMVTHHHGQA